MKRRLTLITEIIAPYRVPVFNALAARDDIDLHVIFLSHTDTNLRQWNVPLNEIRFSYRSTPVVPTAYREVQSTGESGFKTSSRLARDQM